MFAIIKTGGKQYKVAANDIIRVEKLLSPMGDVIEFTDVLMMGSGDSVKVGAPTLANARVCGTVIDQIRDDKIIIFKKNRRHNYRRKNGHRQYLTVVKITDILAEGEKPAPQKAVAEKQVKKDAPSASVKEEKKEAKPAKKEAPVAAKAKKPSATKSSAKSTSKE